MKKIIITGSNGLLGQKVSSILSAETDFDVLMTSNEKENFQGNLKFDYSQLDITNKSDVKSLIHHFKPDVIINCAAFTNVDECENERELAWKLNVDAVKHLIIASRSCNSRIVHISSDHVFDGKKGGYSEEDIPNPINYYGKTKLAAENALKCAEVPFAIIRTMILYGLGRFIKPNFALWVIERLQSKQSISIVDDQLGNPTLVDDLGYAILRIIEGNRTGVYHVCGSESINRYKFALSIAKIFNLNSNLIKPVKTSELSQSAPRPLKSGLNCFKATSEMGIKFLNVEKGLCVLKRQIEHEGYYKLKNQ